ncbi:MAG: BamA/TamA family outer membrane protein [Candidatus Latescibacteria bacterium]|nr:BamA/TamA family outer membrane protein [Candidatus Latescibacterota bacterium]NIO00978.1 BamA/TamA family outer membrane protein [Candidatus Latescibacterota bacterium]NIO27377.1 BamA/TamA family outer membrane protein [Candidatus Latescibacterota bacterium]NIO54899.1 BamA/TamA family outer membrane protein [Candidatus Latescibacterota bacterium]NIT00988.1 BamA/TamA family outer membrane protein [Candidatus Latescibacterota bacterium]
MKKYMRIHVGRSVALIAGLLVFGAQVQAARSAQEQKAARSEVENPDSTEAYPKKRSSRSGWERVVSFPGRIIYLPLKIVFKGGSGLAGWVDDSKIIPKTVDFLTSDDGKRGLYPTYSSRSGAGVKFFQKDLFTEGSRFQMKATVGLRSRQLYEIYLKRVRLFGSPVCGEIRGRYRMLSDENFFGIGPETIDGDKSNFAHERVEALASLSAELGARVNLGLQFGFDHNNILPGHDKSLPSTTDLFTRDTLPGMETEIRMGWAGLVLQYDSKNRMGNPSTGAEAMIRGDLYREVDDDRFGFWRATVDLTRYLHLFYNRVLVFRIASEMTESLSDREVPFFYLSEFGSQETIRGYDRGRFRDNDLILGSVEYRYPIWQRMDAILFFDAGKVAPDMFDDLSKGDLQYAYGGGFRIWSGEGLVMRIELGKGLDKFRFHFNLN